MSALLGEKYVTRKKERRKKEEEKNNNPKNSGYYVPLQRPWAAHAFARTNYLVYETHL